MYDIIDETCDVDMACSKAYYDKINWSEKIECVCDGKKSTLKYQPELVNGVYVQNIYEYLQYLYSVQGKKIRIESN